jgi:hypothetical protein
MREWIYALSPVLIAGYFMIYPHQLGVFLALVGRTLH